MKALPELLDRIPKLKVIMGGRDGAYGAIAPTHNGSWKKKMLDELPSLRNHTRVVFTGLMSYENYR